jgi:RNA recognition motif-containing protein
VVELALSDSQEASTKISCPGNIAFDTRSTTSKGFAYVQYCDADAAVDAYQTLDGKHFQGAT